ncbi:MAG: hypothetical protein PF961_18630 [Planctomycetota bacterium]|jgi:hypothetical protein|nr:hypothetical protein [Planctomycetota bacterium]
MKRSLALLLSLVVLALACGPRFNHVHMYLDEPVPARFANNVRMLFAPDTVLDAKAPAPRDQLFNTMQACLAGTEPDATVWDQLWTQRSHLSLPQRRVVADERALAQLAELQAHQRAALRAGSWAALSPFKDQWWRQLDLGPQPGQAQNDLLDQTDAAGDRARLCALRQAVDEAATDAAQDLLTALNDNAQAPPALRDETAYLQALLTVNQHRRYGADAELARTALDTYLKAWPQGAWRADAIGWQAYLVCRHQGSAAAVALYRQLVSDPQLRSGFLLGLDSLRIVLRRLRPKPPPVVRDDPALMTLFLLQWYRDTGAWPELAHGQGDMLAVFQQADELVLAHDADDRVLIELALLHLSAGDAAGAQALHSHLGTEPLLDARQGYLYLRSLAASGDARTAAEALPRYHELHPSAPDMRDLCLRIGAAFEDEHDYQQALVHYVRGNSWLDVAILCDGIMPVEDLRRFLDSTPELRGWANDSHSGWGQHPQSDYDYAPELRLRLGVRLTRLGRAQEALAYLDRDRAANVRTLLALERAADQREAGPTEVYDLAAFVYHRGAELLVYDRYWHQWAARGALTGTSPEAVLARAELERMTPYTRARDLFAGIARDWPHSPEAPRALYSAALCDFWLCQPSKALGGHNWWWQQRAKDEAYWDHGLTRLRDLRRRYPEHPLCRGAWIDAHLGPMADPEPGR